MYNTKNSIKLNMNIVGNIADTWQLYIKGYEVISDMAYQNTKQEL